MFGALALLLVVSAMIYCGLMVLGYGVGTFVQCGRARSPLLPAVVGLVLVQIIAWYVLTLRKDGLESILTFCLAPFAFVSAAIAAQRTSEIAKVWPWLRGRNGTSYLISTVSVVAAFAVQWEPLLRSGRLTISGPNADVVAYSQISQHLLGSSFGDPGRIVGANLGHVARTDVFGAYALLASIRSVFGISFEHILLPTLLVVFVLIAHVLTRILLVATSLPGLIVGFIVGYVQSIAMVGYIGGNFFLAQLIGMSLAMSIFAVLFEYDSARLRTSSRNVSLDVIAIGLVVAGGLLTYPQMVVIVPLVLLPATYVVQDIKKLFHRGVIYVFGVLLGMAGVFGRVGPAIERTLDLAGDKTNGWPLPALYPSELLGYQGSTKPISHTVTIALSIGIFGLLVGAGIAAWRKGYATPIRFGLITILVSMTSYFAVYRRNNGPSYQQWKWISFFLPIFVVAVLIVLVIGFFSIFPPSRTSKAFVIVLISGLAVLNLMRFEPFYEDVSKAAPVTSSMMHLSKSSVLRDVREMNVAAGPYLSSMWPAFFSTRQRISIVDPSYYSSPPIIGAPTLVSVADAGIIRPPGTKLIGESYALVPAMAGSSTADAANLGASVEVSAASSTVKAGTPITINYRVRNTGQAPWMNMGADLGSIHLGVRQYSRDGVLIADIVRVILSRFPGFLGVGQTAVGSTTLTIAQPGEYRLIVTPVSELVAWFNDLNPDFGSAINVSVVR